MKRKKKFFDRIFFEIHKGFKRFYWSNFQKIRIFILNNKVYNKKIFTISVLIPTKQRSKKFERMLNSFYDKTFKKDRINFYILFDENEFEIDKYKTILDNPKYNDFNFNIFSENFDTSPKRINFLVSKSMDEIIFPFNDDAIINCENWDNIIDEEFSKINYEEPYCIWPECGKKYPYLHTDFPIVNSIWIKRLGYYAKEIFNHWWVDNWICGLCFNYKKFHVVEKLNIYHYPVDASKKIEDETHKDNLQDDKPQKDYLTWHKSFNQIKYDAKKLFVN